jgi:hypothetical protein
MEQSHNDQFFPGLAADLLGVPRVYDSTSWGGDMSPHLRRLTAITFGATVCAVASLAQAQSMDQLY